MKRHPDASTVRRLLVLPAALCVLLAGMVAAAQAEPQVEMKTPGATEFFAKVPGTRIFVAVVTTPEGDGTKLRAYVCDSAGVNEWFVGAVRPGAPFAIASSDGDARLNASLSAADVSGTFTLRSGKTHRFRAGKAKGIAGLYILRISRNGKVTAESERGNRLVGTFDYITGKLVGTITPVGGRPQAIRGTRSGPVVPGEYLDIVSPDGDLRGFQILLPGQLSSATVGIGIPWIWARG